ncbi:MAG: GAF domain-containing protein [Chloroflexi bacterium]|nr:GAF domain-containing protein [Chloroflexota bacterium]
MVTDRAFPYRHWVEFIKWFGLAGLYLIVFALPMPEPERTSMLRFLFFVGAYLIFIFHYLFPRAQYAPRVIYALLVIDVMIVGVLRLLLADYLPDFDLAFVPLIVIAAMVAHRRGVLVLVLTAALTDFVTQLYLSSARPESSLLLALLNQLLILGGFTLIGLTVVVLVETVRRRTVESSEAGDRLAQVERQRREEAERMAQRWELINAVGVFIQEESDPTRIFQVIGGELQKLRLHCFIALWDEPSQKLRLGYVSLAPAARRHLERLVGMSATEFRMNIADMPEFRRALAERRAVFFESSHEFIRRHWPQLSPEFAQRIVELAGLGKHINVPLLARDRSLGLLGLWGPDLDAADLPVMTGLAQQIAVALEKARLFEREQKRAAQLVVVSEIAEKAVGLLDAEELFHEVTLLIVRRFGYENASVFVNEPGTREVVLRAHAGSAINREEIGYRQSWDVGLIGEGARLGKTIVANDVCGDPRYHTDDAERDICRAEMVVPLKRDRETLGVLDVQSTAANVFEAVDVAAMEALANQIAAAVEKRDLFAAERKRAAQLALVSAIAERITAIHDSDQLLRQVVVLIEERFQYHNVALFSLDERMAAVRLRAVAGGDADLFGADYIQSVSVGLIGAAARTGVTINLPDVRQDARFYFPDTRATVTGSELSVPLKMGDKILGVLDLQARERNAFDASDVAAMETLANQIAVALENARLYAQTRNEADVKAALLRELSHRVKNNLGTIVGLLYLGLDQETIPRETILNETLTRVQSMAVAHSLLANSPRARVDVLELSRHVLGDSVRQLTLPGQTVPFVVEGDSFEISAQRAASVALILNELVTNAIKHSGESPEVELRLGVKLMRGQARLEFFSRGARLPEESGRDPANGGLGLQLIRTLVEKDLGGAFVLSSCPDPSGVLGVITFTPEKE